MRSWPKKRIPRPLSPAERLGIIAFTLALALGAIDLRLATVPLTLFVIVCAIAPFLPGTGFFFPVVAKGNTGRRQVALTFDDGPDPHTTPLLLDLLARYCLTATFFVTGSRAERYPHLIHMILDHGHTVGNHTFSHDCFRIFWQPWRLAREIDTTQEILSQAGAIPLAFRPPVGIVTPAMGPILADRNLFLVNFSCRARDWGNRRVKGMARRVLKKVAPDDIILMHDISCGSNERINFWLEEVSFVLEGLEQKRLAVVPLGQLIGKLVMEPL